MTDQIAAQFFTNENEIYLAYTSLLTIMSRLAKASPADVLSGLKSTLMYMHGFRLTNRVQSSWYIEDNTLRIFQRDTVVKLKMAAVFTIGDTTAAITYGGDCEGYEVFVLKTGIGFQPSNALSKEGLDVRTQAIVHRIRVGSIRTVTEEVLSRYGFKFADVGDIFNGGTVFENDDARLAFSNTVDGIRWKLCTK